MPTNVKAIRKRTQIAHANRVMFLWVVGASVIFGISVVVASFLVQMLLFNERVLTAKNQTVSTLDTDNSNIKPLQASDFIIKSECTSGGGFVNAGSNRAAPGCGPA